MDREFAEARVRELEDALLRAQADLFARREGVKTARGNVAYLVGALEEARRFAGCFEVEGGAGER